MPRFFFSTHGSSVQDTQLNPCPPLNRVLVPTASAEVNNSDSPVAGQSGLIHGGTGGEIKSLKKLSMPSFTGIL
jgi:hypothetical protein